ncbi:C40 family peptidase [Xinfangfangia pollutisoli]|uniref:C40 family peptidase n=1 Tax=Xinfangfangia pollutisoli TaxID=2865960 RepID=UPI001CD4D7C6|nr:NlpC/P60 family protein [Xinfangfangia pollutisoli]
MADRRLTPFSGRIAHVSLQGQVEAPLTEGSPARLGLPLVPLLRSPGGALDRTLLFGDAVTVIDRDAGHAFVLSAKDGYCGWVDEAALAPWTPVTHRVATPATHVYAGPKVQAGMRHPLYLTSAVQVLSEDGVWAETPGGFVPSSHLLPLDQPAEDPVAVAEMFLHAPYLWGGNAVSGLDCSGLVQLSLLSAGLACPGDSDQQQAIGQAIPEGAALQRGDLIFWKGHVALMQDATRIIHATAYTMRVIAEPLAPAEARIIAKGEGPVIARRRPTGTPARTP